MEVIKEEPIYAVFTNTDLTEGRGTEYCFALATNEITALRLAKGKYVQGTDARVKECKRLFLKVDDGYGEWYAPSLFVHKPSDEDIQNEIKLFEKRAKDFLLEKFKSGEELTDEEREKIIKWLDKN
jgi:hypothetical protein